MKIKDVANQLLTTFPTNHEREANLLFPLFPLSPPIPTSPLLEKVTPLNGEPQRLHPVSRTLNSSFQRSPPLAAAHQSSKTPSSVSFARKRTGT